MENQTLMSVIEQTAIALKEAVKQYGPDAVDLALKVYQVGAIKDLFVGLFFVVIFVVVMYQWPKIIRFEKEKAGEACGVATLGMVVVSSFLAFIVMKACLDFLFNPFLWMAAFGRPEVLIAKKALEAAGLY